MATFNKTKPARHNLQKPGTDNISQLFKNKSMNSLFVVFHYSITYPGISKPLVKIYRPILWYFAQLKTKTVIKTTASTADHTMSPTLYFTAAIHLSISVL